MNREDFQKSINELLGGCSEQTTGVWIGFAEECVGAEQYAYFAEQPTDKAIESWLDYQYAELYFIKKEFGVDMAKQIFDLANHPEHPHCLYPFEMKEAAKFLRRNYTAKQIVELSVDLGCLDGTARPRTMKGVQRDIAKKQKRDSQER